jgi:hypothetical protein
VKELEEWWYTKRLAPHRKHVVCQVVMTVVAPVVLAKDNLDVAPRGLDGVCVVSGVWIDEMDAVVDGALRETLGVETVVHTRAVADGRSAWFDPFILYLNSIDPILVTITSGNRICQSKANIVRLTPRNTFS